MRVTDQIRNGALKDLRPKLRTGFELLADEAVVVDVTNVYESVRTIAEPKGLYDLPCAAPPYPIMTCEYRQRNGQQMCIAAMSDDGPFTLDGETIGEISGENGYRSTDTLWISDNQPDADAWARTRWLWSLYLFGGMSGKVVGPMTRVRAALDEWGQLRDVEYCVYVKNVDHGTMIQNPFVVFMTAINFMQCANIHTVYHEPDDKLARKHRRKGRAPKGLRGWHTIELKPGPGQRERSGPTDFSALTAHHTVHACFHHYGDCCPGAHAPKGLFFGKHTGRYWVPGHARGNRGAGQIDKDYKLTPGDVK